MIDRSVDRQRSLLVTTLVAVVLLALWAQPVCAKPASVAVFNFQMKSDTLEWVWLEKGLADRIATDFFRDGTIQVTARDEMQRLAAEMSWVPEMASDSAKAGQISRQLRIDHLVSGVYSIQTDRITITAQVIELASRKELARKSVEGKADDVLELQRQLSSQLLEWFTKQPAATILPQLPVWTKSLPAVKALYLGMNLYDQGRYTEAWLEFRRSAKADAGYVEAQYWVGKMYYFLNRYEHARRSLEQFVYMDRTHPRTGDALVEYVHTFENSNADSQSLLDMFDWMSTHFPEAAIPSPPGWGLDNFTKGSDWFHWRMATLCYRQGRYSEALSKNGIPATGYVNPDNFNYEQPPVYLASLLNHHVLTGQFKQSQVQYYRPRAIVVFDSDNLRGECTFPEPIRVKGNDDDILVTRSGEQKYMLEAPEGFIFKSLLFLPRLEGDASLLDFKLEFVDFTAFDPPGIPCTPRRVMKEKQVGILFDKLPRFGLFNVICSAQAKEGQPAGIQVSGFQVVAELEKVGPCGSLQVDCPDFPDFLVYVDGAFARGSAGLIGPLAPGKHLVELRASDEDSVRTPWTGEVLIAEGKTTKVEGRLPLTAPFEAWKASRLDGSYRQLDLEFGKLTGPPALLADDKGIRVIWAHNGDLWYSFSSDGLAYSPAKRLPLPISTGWLETSPHLILDESGRYVLTFVSNRDGQHRQLPYMCWSRDLEHWSEPAVICEISMFNYDFVQYRGNYILASQYANVVFFASRDGVNWRKLSNLDTLYGPNMSIVSPQFVKRPDGALDLFFVEDGSRVENGVSHCRVAVEKTSTTDGSTWAAPVIIQEEHYRSGRPRLCATLRQDELVMMLARRPLSPHRGDAAPVVTSFLGKNGNNSWMASEKFTGLACSDNSMQWHPRWGLVVASQSPAGADWAPREDFGPSIIRGFTLPSMNLPVNILSNEALASKEPPDRHITRLMGPDGKLYQVWKIDIPDVKFKEHVPLPAKEMIPGRLYYYAIAANYGPTPITTEKFQTASSGCGTTNPKALTAKVKFGGADISIAIDSKAATAGEFDILRLDLTGKNDFSHAIVLPRTNYSYQPATDTWLYSFKGQDVVTLSVGSRQLPVNVEAIYEQTKTSRSFDIRFHSAAEAMCRFGDKLHRVTLHVQNPELRIDVPALIGKDSQNLIYIDEGDIQTGGSTGEPVLVDGKLWSLSLNADATEVTSRPFTGATGTLAIDHSSWSAWLVKDEKNYEIIGGKSPVPLPAGQYVINCFCEHSSSPRVPTNPYLNSYGVNVEIKAGEATKLVIGSPIKGSLTAQVNGRSVAVEYKEWDAGGNKTGIGVPGELTRPNPFVTVYDAAGKSIIRLELDSSFKATWKAPPDATGKFSIAFEPDAKPFYGTPAKTTFELP